jgi:hypothetical protein
VRAPQTSLTTHGRKQFIVIKDDKDDLDKPWPEVRLWRAVLLQMVEDAAFTYRPIQRKNFHSMTDEEKAKATKSRNSLTAEAQRNRNIARAWLLGNSKDFREVCHLAQLDPEAVRDNAQRLARQGWPSPNRKYQQRIVVGDSDETAAAKSSR